MEGPKPAQGQEIHSAAELARRVFHPDTPAPVRPALPGDAVRPNLRVFSDRGRVTAAVTMNHRPVVLGGTRHLACTFGGVCTDPEYRGQGLATQLLEDCRRKALADGADLVLISGSRGLYRHSGYAPVGHFEVSRIPRAGLTAAAALSERYDLRPALSDDLPALMRMQVEEPVRFVRSPEEMLRLVGQTSIVNGRGRTFVVCRNGAGPVAWMTCQIGGRYGEDMPPNSTRVVEVGGSRWAVLCALPVLMDRQKVDEVELFYGGWDRDFARMAADLGWPSEPRSFRGTVGIIAPQRFWDASVALFRERLGPERFETLRFEVRPDAIEIASGTERLLLKDWTALTELVFMHPAQRTERPLDLPRDSDLATALDEIFPMPLVNYGLNYF
ncbi:MAG: GNAT family N-acetyltransferase [Candidatus Brocadiaceae bacterium]|nr:GNAT family N-acetyltransferase [Candidatus Brocadiaceae bacterium]